jgi:hypothetical protein
MVFRDHNRSCDNNIDSVVNTVSCHDSRASIPDRKFPGVITSGKEEALTCHDLCIVFRTCESFQMFSCDCECFNESFIGPGDNCIPRELDGNEHSIESYHFYCFTKSYKIGFIKQNLGR